MRTPLRCQHESSICVNEITKFVKRDATISTYVFYTGVLELRLAEYDHPITAHTTNPFVYEFWQHAVEDPEQLYGIVTHPKFKFDGPGSFERMQRLWPHREGALRAALFYTLNRCSDSGYVSSGALEPAGFNAHAHSRLRTVSFPENFELILDDNLKVMEQLEGPSESEYTLAHLGHFSHNFFEYGRLRGPEETPVDHRRIKDFLQRTERKCIMIYKYHPELCSFYGQFNLRCVDQHGHPADPTSEYEEAIVTNF